MDWPMVNSDGTDGTSEEEDEDIVQQVVTNDQRDYFVFNDDLDDPDAGVPEVLFGASAASGPTRSQEKKSDKGIVHD